MRKFLLSLAALMAVAIGANAQAEPTYYATGTVGPYSEWASYYTTPFSAENVQVEVYGADSVIVRSWCGVEGYDICVTLDADTVPSSAYSIVNGAADAYGSGGWYYVYSGLESPGDVPFYVANGYAWYSSDEETKTGYLLLYAYVNNAYNYYYVTWEPSTSYKAIGTVGEVPEGWEDYQSLITDIDSVDVEVYGNDSIVVRKWTGVDGYDLGVMLGEDGEVSSVYYYYIDDVTGERIQYSYAWGSYWYVETGLVEEGDLYGGYIYTPSSQWYKDDEARTGGMILNVDPGYTVDSTTAWGGEISGCYYITWGPMKATSGIKAVAAPVADDGKIYNIAGQRVGESYKGLVIKNGKKYIQR